MLTPRVEKYSGYTLLVDSTNEWFTIVHEATGMTIEGPVSTDKELKALVGYAIASLRGMAALTQQMKEMS